MAEAVDVQWVALEYLRELLSFVGGGAWSVVDGAVGGGVCDVEITEDDGGFGLKASDGGVQGGVAEALRCWGRGLEASEWHVDRDEGDGRELHGEKAAVEFGVGEVD